MEQQTALIIDCNRNGLGLARSLGKEKIKVVVADPQKGCPAFFSRHATHHFVVPDIRFEKGKIIDQLVGFGRKNAGNPKIFLFPTNDVYVHLFSECWERLEPYFVPVLETNMEKLLRCMDKAEICWLARQAGIPHPKTWFSLDEIGKDVRFPVIVKPALRRPETIASFPFKTQLCHNGQELQAAVGALKSKNIRFVAQEFLPGGDDQLFTVGIAAIGGRIYGKATARKLRQFPPQTGECSYGELVASKKLMELGSRLIETAGATGIFQVEFKFFNGDFYLIEINPRSWSWNNLMEYAGVNLPLIFIKASRNEIEEVVAPVKTKGRWSFALMDFYHNVYKNRNVGIFKFLLQAILSNRHAYWSWKDPLPALVFWLGAIGRRLSA